MRILENTLPDQKGNQMNFDEFYKLTAGQRMKKRGTTAPRPFQKDWANSQMTAIADAGVQNPWLRQELGDNIDVSIQRTKNKQTIIVLFTRAKPDKPFPQ